MADKAPEQEPSIEEILASIRQIISDDEDQDSGEVAEEAAPAPKPAPEPEKKPEPVPVAELADLEEEEEDDVLELTDAVPDESPVFEAPAEAKIEIDLQDKAPEPPEQPAEVEMETPKFEPSAAVTEDILTEAAKSATISSMAKLAGNMPITKHREYGNITLEDLVREMLHPMLRDWLSDNLPPMVERMVQKELEKLARRAMDD